MTNMKKQLMIAFLSATMLGASGTVSAADVVKDTISAGLGSTVEGTMQDTLTVNGSVELSSDPKGVVYADKGGTVEISKWNTVSITPGKGYGIQVGNTGENAVKIHDVNTVEINTVETNTPSNFGIRNEGGTVDIDANDVSITAKKYAIWAGNSAESNVDDTNTTTIKASGNVELTGGVQISGGLTGGATSSVDIQGQNVTIKAQSVYSALDVSGKKTGGTSSFSVNAAKALTIEGQVAIGTEGDVTKNTLTGETVKITNTSGNAVDVQDLSGANGQAADVTINGKNLEISSSVSSLATSNGTITLNQEGADGSVKLVGSILTRNNGTTNLSAEGDTSASDGSFITQEGGNLNFQKGSWSINAWKGTDGNLAVQNGAAIELNTNVTVDKVTLAEGSTTVINAGKVSGTAITVTDAVGSTISDQAEIKVNNFKVGDTLAVLGTDSTDDAQKNAANTLNQKAVDQLVSDNILQDFMVNQDGQIEIIVGDVSSVLSDSVLVNALEAVTAAGDTRFDPFLKSSEDKAVISARLNAAANIAELGGAAHGTYVVSGLFGDALHGKAAKDDQVWAKAFHSKDSVRGLGLAGVAASYDGQYNGAAFGVDFYQKEGMSAGAALLYADGSVSGAHSAAYTKNEAAFWGAALYGRVEKESYTLTGDISYLGGSHDITQWNGTAVITASPDTEAWSLGLKAQKSYTAGRGTLTPYVGARYLHLVTDSYTSSLGLHYESADQDLFLIPVGVDWEAGIRRGTWTLRPYAGVGYVWTLGDRSASTTASYNGAGDVLAYDTADSGSVLVRAGLSAEKKSTVLGVGYHWQKGSTTENQTWHLHVGYRF